MWSTTNIEERTIRNSSSVPELLKNIADLRTIGVEGGKPLTAARNIAGVLSWSAYNEGPKCYSTKGEVDSRGTVKLRSVSVELIDLLAEAGTVVDVREVMRELRLIETDEVQKVRGKRVVSAEVMTDLFGIRETAMVRVSEYAAARKSRSGLRAALAKLRRPTADESANVESAEA